MGNRTPTTWDSGWNSGVTKTIRLPVALANEVIRYARALDNGDEWTTKKFLDEFIEVKRRQSRNLPRRFFTMDSTQWIIFNEFRRWLEYRKGV
jgi:hypothetical protein